MGQVLSNVLRCICIFGEAEDESDQNPIEISSSHALLSISPPVIPPSKTITTSPEEFLQTPSKSCLNFLDSTSNTTIESGLHQNLLSTPRPRSVLDYYAQTDSTTVADTIMVQNDALFSSSSISEESIISDGDKNLKEPRGKEEGIEEEEKVIVRTPSVPNFLSTPRSVLDYYPQRESSTAVDTIIVQEDTLFSSSLISEESLISDGDKNLKETRGKEEGIEEEEKVIVRTPFDPNFLSIYGEIGQQIWDGWSINKAVEIEEIRWMKHYSSLQKILLVGEGDFSFSASLARAFGTAGNIIATSLNSTGFLTKNYRSAMSNIQNLRSRGAKVMHEVDATKMANQILFQGMTFDRIVFNFPLSGFFPDESRESKLRRERKLVRLFIANAREMITERGEIHVTHKSNAFHREWRLEELASSEGLQLIDEVHFNFIDFPGYHTKYGFGGDNNFNCNPSKTYKFGL